MREPTVLPAELCPLCFGFCANPRVSHSDCAASSVWMRRSSALAKQHRTLCQPHKMKDALHPRCLYRDSQVGKMLQRSAGKLTRCGC